MVPWPTIDIPAALRGIVSAIVPRPIDNGTATFGPYTTFVGDLSAGHAIVQAARPKAKRTKVVARHPADPRWWLHPTKGWRRR